MSRHIHRTTVRLEEGLLEQAKREAARRGETLTSLIELGLRLAIAQSRPGRRPPPIDLPVCTQGGGTFPGIDLNSTSQLLDIMDGIGTPDFDLNKLR
jgi:hypothetical protein